MKIIHILILAFLFTANELNASANLFELKNCIGKQNCPIKHIKTKQIDEYIYVEVYINTLPDEISKGIKQFAFQILDSQNPTAPPIYSFTTEQRLDVVVTFSFSKDKIEQIEGNLTLWGPVLHETAVEIIDCYIFEIKDYLEDNTAPVKIDNKKAGSTSTSKNNK